MVDAETGDRPPEEPEDWTADERRRLNALPQERGPTPALEERTIAALRTRGLLAGGERPRPQRVLMLAMAASAVFAAGVGAGYLAAMRAVAAREAAGTATAPSAGARSETLAVRTSGGRQVTWY